jgi:hypothetical protein
MYARIDVTAPEIHVAAPIFIGVLTGVSVCINITQHTPSQCMPCAHARLLAVELCEFIISQQTP